LGLVDLELDRKKKIKGTAMASNARMCIKNQSLKSQKNIARESRESRESRSHFVAPREASLSMSVTSRAENSSVFEYKRGENAEDDEYSDEDEDEEYSGEESEEECQPFDCTCKACLYRALFGHDEEDPVNRDAFVADKRREKLRMKLEMSKKQKNQKALPPPVSQPKHDKRKIDDLISFINGNDSKSSAVQLSI